jgi:hypothetical protein
MITTHNAIRAFMERNMFAPQPRAQPEENFDDLIGDALPENFILLDDVYVPGVATKPKGRPPGKHNLRSKGKSAGWGNLLTTAIAVAREQREEPENFDDLI